MSALGWLIVAMAAFVGTHFLLSHPWRASLVRRLGDQGFLGVYSLVAAATLGAAVWANGRVPDQAPLWGAGRGGWDRATLLMLLASILLAGSLVRNPAFPGITAGPIPESPRGVYAVTRHPMMWSFMMWAIVHAWLWGTPATLVICAGIFLLAFVGARAQDGRKVRLMGADWQAWARRTSFWPFGAQLGGRLPWRSAVPGIGILLAGVAIWLVATWAHPAAGGPVAGPWRWFG